MTEVKELVPGGESISVDKNNRWAALLIRYFSKATIWADSMFLRINILAPLTLFNEYFNALHFFFLKNKQKTVRFLNILFFQHQDYHVAHTAGSSCPIVPTEGHVLCWKHRKQRFWVFFSSVAALFLQLVLVPVALITVLCAGVRRELWGGRCQHVWLLVLNRWRERQWPELFLQNPINTLI